MSRQEAGSAATGDKQEARSASDRYEKVFNIANTVTGTFNLSSPHPGDVNALDLAWGLARQTRFNGHYRLNIPLAENSIYSVGQHSCHVSDALRGHGPRVQLYGLLHDAHEAYLGDWITPVKDEIARHLAPYMIEALRTIEKRVARAVHEAFGLSWPPGPAARDAVHLVDMAMLASEREHLLSPPFDHWPALPDPLPFKRFEIWDIAGAANGFLRRLDELRLEGGVQ